VVSRTATEKLHCAWLQESAAVHVTVVEPPGKEEPERAEHVTVAPAEAVGAVHEAVAPVPHEHSVTTLAGQVMVAEAGAVTVTVKLPEAWLPALSVAVHETVVVPTGKL